MEDQLYALLGVYRDLPGPIQDVLGTAYRWLPKRLRYGSFYADYARRIRDFVESGPDTRHLRQLHLVCDTVNEAIVDIPFYSGRPRIDSFETFERLPVVGKSDILDDPSAFVSPRHLAAGLRSNTGGSSGTPLSFYLHAGRTRPKERAHFDWFWAKWGYRPGDRLLSVRGGPLRDDALFEYQRIKNCLAVSCYHLNESNVERVRQEAERFGPKFIHGYPSAVKNVIRCLQERGRSNVGFPVSAVFLGSELLLPADRDEIAHFFHAPVVTWYGHSECASMGGNTPTSAEFHFFPFYGYTELLDTHGNQVTTPGQTGRIVSTSFDNRVMPFIRYDTGDLGVLSRASGSDDVSCLVLSRIEGRAQDMILLSDRTKVSLTAFIFGQHLPEFAAIREIQLVQERPGHLRVRIVRGSRYTHGHTRSLVARLQDSVSGKIAIECEFVDRIEKTRRGKHAFLVQGAQRRS